MAHASSAEIEEMDDGEATSTDIVVDGDVRLSVASSDDTEKGQETAKLVGVIRRKLDMVHSLRTIFRIPEFVFDENPGAYVPHMVSIGPFHHNERHLQPMEALKIQYLEHFLRRDPPRELKDYVEAIKDLVERANQCYAEVLTPKKKKKRNAEVLTTKKKKKRNAEVKVHERKSAVVTMMVDGCFILELLLMLRETEPDEKWIFLVLPDLILLENQLPFFVVEALYEVFSKNSGHDLSRVMRKFFVPQILRLLFGDVKINNSPGDIEIEPKHLLDLVRQSLKPLEQTATNDKKNFHFAAVGIRCATELEKAGVKFKKNEKPTSLLDIKFDSANGDLTIPGIKIDHSTQSIFRNLVAYEQYTDDYNYITEYAAFLDGLIDSRNDVEVLQKNGIIETMLGDPSEIAGLFNSLLKDSVVTFNYTIHVRLEVEQYYNVPWHKWKASLMLNYFNTPWSLISVIAAIILLVLTFTQTYYSVKPYIRFD